MNDFLDAAYTLSKSFSPRDKDFDLVFKGRDALQSVFSKASLDLMNLESVFTAFEMARLLKRLGSLSMQVLHAIHGA
jgi:hypothetical protein